MENKIIKKAYNSAEEELKDKNVKRFKDIIKKTLEKLEQKQKEQRGVVKEIQILKADIKDFKEGRLDRISERQEKSPKAREVSIALIKKGEIVEKYWQQPYIFTTPTFTGTWTNGLCSNNTSGTYVLVSGTEKYI